MHQSHWCQPTDLSRSLLETDKISVSCTVFNKGWQPAKFPIYFSWFCRILWLRTWVKWDKWHETFLCKTWRFDWPIFIHKTQQKVARIPSNYRWWVEFVQKQLRWVTWLLRITSESGWERIQYKSMCSENHSCMTWSCSLSVQSLNKLNVGCLPQRGKQLCWVFCHKSDIIKRHVYIPWVF